MLRRVDSLSRIPPEEGGGVRLECAYKVGDRVRHADLPLVGVVSGVEFVSGPFVFYTVDVDESPTSTVKRFVTRAWFLKAIPALCHGPVV